MNRKLPILALAAALSASAAAHADSSCDAYKGELGSSLMDGTSDASGAQFTSAGSQHEAARARIQASTTIPDSCKKELLNDLGRNSFNFSVRGNFGAGATQGVLGKSPTIWPEQWQHAVGIYSAYNGLAASYLQANLPAGCNTQQCIAMKAPGIYQQFSQQFNNNPQALASQYGYSIASSDNATLQAYQSVISGNEANALAFVASSKNTLSKAQFLDVVQMMGQRMGDDYDNNRTITSNPASKGIVTGDQLLTAALNNTENGYEGLPTSYAGVCRDIATLQAKMLQARGFPNSYILTYQLPGLEGHADVVSQDPDSPTTIYRFNYDHMVTLVDADGPIAIFQQNSGRVVGLPDGALNYMLYRPEGWAAADVPSEMGKFLSEAAGFDMHMLDPLARDTTSMLGANFAHDTTGQGTTLDGRAVLGQDGVGGQYIGAAGGVSYGQGTLLPGRVGIFVGDENRPGALFGMNGDDNMAIGYLQVEQHVLTPTAKLKHDITIRLDTSLTALGMFGYMLPGGPDAGKPMLDGDIRLRTELQMHQTALHGKLDSTYRAGVEISPGTSDVRDAAAPPVPILNSAYAATEQRLRVAARVMLLASMAVAVDELGTRGQVSFGVATPKFAATVFASGRLGNGTALYEDNTIRRVGASLIYQPNKHLKFTLTGQAPVEGSDPLNEATLTGNVQVDY